MAIIIANDEKVLSTNMEIFKKRLGNITYICNVLYIKMTNKITKEIDSKGRK